jgi:hypothetical protein
MFKQLMYKWFGLDPRTCEACEILRVQLDESNVERRELLHRLLDKDKTEPLPVMKEEEMKPIGNQHIPWRVRQQMLEQEDRVKARLMKDRTKEIEDLEKSLEIHADGVK